MQKRRVRIVSNVYMALILVFLYAPIAILIFYSFNASKTMATWSGFSLKWYIELFQDQKIRDILGVTISCALISSVVATIMGTSAAIGINAMKRRRRSTILSLTNLPVINPDLVTGISLMLMFGFLSFKLGFWTMVLAHITFNLPYVILSVMPRLRQSSDQYYEAALDLGATPIYALWKVIIPEIMPGIITGAILAFTLSIDDFVISFFTRSGADSQNLSNYIYSTARRGISPKVNALSAIMFVTILALLLIVNLRSTREAKLVKEKK